MADALTGWDESRLATWNNLTFLEAMAVIIIGHLPLGVQEALVVSVLRRVHFHPIQPPLRDRHGEFRVLRFEDPHGGHAFPHGLRGLGRVPRRVLPHEFRDAVFVAERVPQALD